LIGTAGWSLPRAEQQHFPATGSHLERYAARFRAVEINSSFHRSHRAATWLRWRDSVPPGFLFSIKVPKAITHTLRLEEAAEPLAIFLEEIALLGESVGCLLVQLPPSLSFDARVASKFFTELRARAPMSIACEPRHESWFTHEADESLRQHEIARVAADPARVPAAARPGGWRGFSYYRLHGSPKMYYSAYEGSFLKTLAGEIEQDLAAERAVWAIFDNTTLGAATGNALDLSELLAKT
jgi:uncharacterized protein YecE (DUF72 family)